MNTAGLETCTGSYLPVLASVSWLVEAYPLHLHGRKCSFTRQALEPSGEDHMGLSLTNRLTMIAEAPAQRCLKATGARRNTYFHRTISGRTKNSLSY